MKFFCTIIVVEDIARSRLLYESILHQKVTAEFGDNNIAYEGGLAFYKKSLYQSLIGEREIAGRPNSFELYFEEDRLAEVENEISRQGFEFIHKIREEPWKQRVFRFYDADNNIVVIAETMEQVAYRLFGENHSIDEIGALTGFAADQVARQIEAYRKTLTP
jgi:hypothetical protein